MTIHQGIHLAIGPLTFLFVREDGQYIIIHLMTVFADKIPRTILFEVCRPLWGCAFHKSELNVRQLQYDPYLEEGYCQWGTAGLADLRVYSQTLNYIKYSFLGTGNSLFTYEFAGTPPEVSYWSGLVVLLLSMGE